VSATLVKTRPVAIDSDVLRQSKHPGARAAREQADWLSWLEAGNLAPRTLDDYSWMSDRLLEKFPQKEFVDFTDGDLLYVLKRVPAPSRHTRAAALRSWFKWGVKTRRRLDNPCDLLPDMKRVAPKIVDVFTPREVNLLTSLRSPDGQLMTILFEAGLRKSEARHLRVKDFDLERRDLKLRTATKGSKERVVVISGELSTAIEELVTLEGLNREDYFWGVRPGGRKIKHDRPIGNASFHKWWGDCLADARVDYRKPHTTRHTYATTWRERGLPLDDLRMMLGHSSIQTTSDLYVHTKVSDVRRRMDELMGE
jgi:integrase